MTEKDDLFGEEEKKPSKKKAKDSLTNLTKGPLGLPDGQIVQPGDSVKVDWEKLKNHGVIKQWIEKGVLS